MSSRWNWTKMEKWNLPRREGTEGRSTREFSSVWSSRI